MKKSMMVFGGAVVATLGINQAALANAFGDTGNSASPPWFQEVTTASEQRPGAPMMLAAGVDTRIERRHDSVENTADRVEDKQDHREDRRDCVGDGPDCRSDNRQDKRQDTVDRAEDLVDDRHDRW